MLRVPGVAQSPSSGEEEQITEWHAKRFSNATDTSQEAPSIATTTASGQDRRAADDANRDTLLAFWEAEQRGNRDIAQGTSPSSFQRHSWASNRSASRASSERRNLNAYRPVAGRWTSSMDDPDTVGLAQTTDERIESGGNSLARGSTEAGMATTPTSLPNVMPAAEAVKELHRKSLTPTPLETVEEQSVDEQALRSDSSPTRSYRKPVPAEHLDGFEDGSNRVSVTTPPPPLSPLRRSLLPMHRRSATTESSSAASKRASEQSHLSAATGALHQHVERLRAGPQYQKDENALHLLGAVPEATPSSSSFASRALPPVSAAQPDVGLSPSSPQKRGRAWSLSLLNKLKNRTRKSSESSSLLSARVPSFGRLDSPSILTLKPQSSAAEGIRPTPPISPLASMRREAEIGQQQQQSPASPAKEHGQGAHTLYQLARRPLRKAAPTTASSDAEVFTAPPPSELITAAVQSPTMQRSFSATSQPRQRPASIGSRKSSRSRHSSDGSIRAVARRRPAPLKSSGDGSDKENGLGMTSKSAAAKATSGGTASPSAAWWNPWSSRKNSTAGLTNGEAGKEEADEWIDEPENETGIISPVAEDPNKRPMKRQDSNQSQIHWSPAKASRLEGGSEGSTARQSSSAVNLLDDSMGRRGSSHDDKEIYAVASGAVAPFSPLTASSSFSSLAPTPAPALVPPPRPNRRGKRADSGSRRASSTSSPNSPAIMNDEGRFESSGEIQPSPVADPLTPTLLQAPQPRTAGSSVAGTETRESLLSDDLDYVTPQDNEVRNSADESAVDILDEAATLNGYRASLPETGRRPRGIAPHLSPVREIMTPDSRVLSDDRSGALSAASTIDHRAHRRISSGASMGRFVTGQNTAAEHVQERRPIPAPSVVAEPHANLSPVHRASSITSSFGTSTVGGGGVGRVSFSSMKKHTGQHTDLAGSIATAVKRRARQDGGHIGGDSRSRSTSMPTKPQSPLSSIDSTVSQAADHSMTGPTTSQRKSVLRESWRSSVDGPWDGRVVSVANVVQLPAAKGLGTPSAGTIRRQRSRSQPMNVMLDGEKDGIEGDEISSEMLDDFSHEPPTAVPFAETAVQASLAALQALEMKEEAEKVGGWRARWASEKLLGFSTSSQPGASLLGSRWTTEAVEGDGERRKHRHARKSEPLRPDSRSDSADSAQQSAFLAVSKSSAMQPSPLANRSFAQDVSIDGLPATSNRVISAAEWDETVVPAHAKRMSYGKENAAVVEEEAQPFATYGLLASGMVAAVPASPDEIAFPTIQDEEKQHATRVQQQEEKSIVDHGSQYSYNTRKSHNRKEKSSTYRRREGSDRGDPTRSHRRRRRHRGVGEDDNSGGGGGGKTRHDKYPTISSAAASLAKSSTKSRIVRRGYGCDDIVAWQASLSIAAMPSVTEL